MQLAEINCGAQIVEACAYRFSKRAGRAGIHLIHFTAAGQSFAIMSFSGHIFQTCQAENGSTSDSVVDCPSLHGYRQEKTKL